MQAGPVVAWAQSTKITPLWRSWTMLSARRSPWTILSPLAPQLILAGARPGDVAKALETHPASASDPDTATAFLTALTGHWQRNARLPSPPGAPGLRAYQHRAAAAGLSLLVQRLR